MFRNLIPGHLCPDGQALPVSLLLSFGDCARLRKEKSIASPVPGQGGGRTRGVLGSSAGVSGRLI